MDMTATAPRRKFPLSLVLIALIFALPPLMGWLYFLNPQWLPDKHNNNGVLVHPAQPIYRLQLTRADGSLVTEESLSDAWRMVVVAERRCDDSCQQLLDSLGQVQKATGAGRARLKPVLLVLDSEVAPTDFETDQHESFFAASASAKAVAKLFDLEKNTISETSFVIDPMGALMMQHDHSVLSQKQVLRDMEKLLKISQNWVKGAQYGHN